MLIMEFRYLVRKRVNLGRRRSLVQPQKAMPRNFMKARTLKNGISINVIYGSTTVTICMVHAYQNYLKMLRS